MATKSRKAETDTPEETPAPVAEPTAQQPAADNGQKPEDTQETTPSEVTFETILAEIPDEDLDTLFKALGDRLDGVPSVSERVERLAQKRADTRTSEEFLEARKAEIDRQVGQLLARVEEKFYKGLPEDADRSSYAETLKEYGNTAASWADQQRDAELMHVLRLHPVYQMLTDEDKRKFDSVKGQDALTAMRVRLHTIFDRALASAATSAKAKDDKEKTERLAALLKAAKASPTQVPGTGAAEPTTQREAEKLHVDGKITNEQMRHYRRTLPY